MFRVISNLLGNHLRLRVVRSLIVGGPMTAEAIAAVVGYPRDVVRREVAALMRLSMVTARGKVSARSYVLNDDHPLLKPLSDFLARAALPADRTITALFRGVRGLSLVVLSGIFTNAEASPVDVLIVVRDSDQKLIERTVRKLEILVAAPLRFSILNTASFEERRHVHDRLLRDVFEYPHRIIIDRRTA